MRRPFTVRQLLASAVGSGISELAKLTGLNYRLLGAGRSTKLDPFGFAHTYNAQLGKNGAVTCATASSSARVRSEKSNLCLSLANARVDVIDVGVNGRLD